MNPQESEPTPESFIPQQPQVTQTTSTPQPQKIGKFRGSIMLVQESFNVLKQDKELAWFPVLSAITSVVALALFVAIFFFVVIGGDITIFDDMNEENLNTAGYIIAFVYYLIMFFIANYFLAGIYTITNGRFNGQDLSFGDGIKNANKHIGRIFIWSLISATVGIILRIISDKSKLIGKIIAALFGAVWTILTYFSLPSLVIGERTIKESFNESASAIRKTWGETIIVNLGMGLFFGLVSFAVIILMIGILILVPTTAMLILIGILFVIYMITVIIVSSTLGSIVKLALYIYATTGTVPQGFTPELIQNVVKTGK